MLVSWCLMPLVKSLTKIWKSGTKNCVSIDLTYQSFVLSTKSMVKSCLDIWLIQYTLLCKPQTIVSFAANMDVTQQRFAFPEKNGIPLYYVSASNGTNVVKVRNTATMKEKGNSSEFQKLRTNVAAFCQIY